MIILYTTKDDSNKVDKTLTELKRFDTMEYLEPTTVENPTYTLPLSDGSIVGRCNYLFDSKFSRYYFCKSSVEPGAIRLDCNVDVLMSFKEEIRTLKCTVARNENLKNGYLVDSMYKSYAYDIISNRVFPNAINEDTAILMTIG